MPKIKDLGITVLPEGVGPVGIGGGAGGACGCTNVTNPCLGCTQNFQTGLPGCGCTNITNPCMCTQNPTVVGCGCTNITNPCFGCTRAVTIPNPCTGGTITACRFGTCGLTQTPCGGGTRWPTTDPTTITPHTPVIRPGALSADDITTLRQQLRQRLEDLDAHEKSLGDPHFEQRELKLQQELEQLQARRAELKNK
ncbi:MAG TPA: hypothetical protein VGF48_21220 [Thermoanaerobaculia bacterium]|jgi:hypothetical protein